jgi:hypothetical protein
MAVVVRGENGYTAVAADLQSTTVIEVIVGLVLVVFFFRTYHIDVLLACGIVYAWYTEWSSAPISVLFTAALFLAEEASPRSDLGLVTRTAWLGSK